MDGEKVKAEELFGDLDVSDDSDASDAPAPKRRVQVSDDEEDSRSQSDDSNRDRNRRQIEDDDEEEVNLFTIPGSEDEIEPEEVEEEKIEVDIPKIDLDLGNNIDFFKLPNFLSIQSHPYDPLWYEDEIDEGEVHDEEGRQRLKLKVENTIRWKKMIDESTGEITRESNARIVKWSDGSSSLHLGDEVFDITTRNMQTIDNHLFIRQGTGLQGQAVFKTKLTFRPYSTDSITHKKLTLSLADRSQKKQKIRVLPMVGSDPEAGKWQKIKNEEQALRMSMRNESKQRRIKDKSYHKGPSAGYLEGDDDEDENSIAKIKSDFKKNKANPNRYERDVSTSDSDSDDEVRNYSLCFFLFYFCSENFF